VSLVGSPCLLGDGGGNNYPLNDGQTTMNSAQCKDKVTGQPLKCYEDEWSARVDLAKEWFFRATPLRVKSCWMCGKFHLYPESGEQSATPQLRCSKCKRSDGEGKASYPSNLSALAAMKRLTNDQGMPTRAYPCPHGYGWHVTTKPLNQARALDEYGLAKMDHLVAMEEAEKLRIAKFKKEQLADFMLRRADIKRRKGLT
jgi:hypothetical protein